MERPASAATGLVKKKDLAIWWFSSSLFFPHFIPALNRISQLLLAMSSQSEAYHTQLTATPRTYTGT